MRKNAFGIQMLRYVKNMFCTRVPIILKMVQLSLNMLLTETPVPAMSVQDFFLLHLYNTDVPAAVHRLTQSHTNTQCLCQNYTTVI